MTRDSRKPDADDSHESHESRDSHGSVHNLDDLDWLAFCYIADELSEPDRSEFELRLEYDPVAQQAIVEALEQAQLIHAGCDEAIFQDFDRSDSEQTDTARVGRAVPAPVSVPTATPHVRRAWRRRGLVLTAAAAMLLMLLEWNWHSDQQPMPVSLVNLDLALADVWAETEMPSDEDDFDDFADLDGDLDLTESFGTESYDAKSYDAENDNHPESDDIADYGDEYDDDYGDQEYAGRDYSNDNYSNDNYSNDDYSDDNYSDDEDDWMLVALTEMSAASIDDKHSSEDGPELEIDNEEVLNTLAAPMEIK